MQNLKRNSNAVAAILIASVVLIIAFFAMALKAHANPSDLNLSNTTATTTVSYLTAAGASTTETYDTYQGGVGDPNASESAVLFTQYAASSSSAILAIRIQYSQNGIDWYDDNLTASTLGTTTQPYNVGVANSFTWAAVNTATSSKAITIPTPTRFVRASYSVTGANAAVYKVIIAKKEQPE